MAWRQGRLGGGVSPSATCTGNGECVYSGGTESWLLSVEFPVCKSAPRSIAVQQGSSYLRGSPSSREVLSLVGSGPDVIGSLRLTLT